MRDVWEQMGPLLMQRQRGKEGRRRQEDRWREGKRGVVMRDAPDVLRKKNWGQGWE